MAVDLLLHRRLLREQRVEVGVGLGERGRDRVEAVEQVAQLADAVLDVAAHVLGRIELGLLLEEADGGAGMQLGDAGRRLLEPGHDPHQRRLAGAVRAEHADLRSGQERQRDVRQHLPVGAVELVDPVHRVDVVAAHEIASWVSGGLARWPARRRRSGPSRASGGYRRQSSGVSANGRLERIVGSRAFVAADYAATGAMRRTCSRACAIASGVEAKTCLSCASSS